MRKLCVVALVVPLLLVAAPRPPSSQTVSVSETGVLRATLDNGLRILIVRNALAPVVTTTVSYLVGANETPPGFPGMAHALEHMMFRGSPDLSAAQLAYIGAAMGGDFNATTQQTATQYVFTVAAQDLDVALRIEAIRMRGVLNAAAAWRQERGAIEQEVAQNLSNPQYQLYTKLLAGLFEGTPYAHHGLGTRASFQRTTGAMLKKFYDTWYAPNNAVLVIAGDVDPDAALAQVRALFGPIAKKSLPPRPRVTLRPVKPRTLRLRSDLPYGLAVVAVRLPGYADPDYAAAQVLGAVLGSQRGDLQELVATGEVLDAGFSFDPLPKGGLGYASVAFPQGTSAAPALEKLRAVLNKAAAHGVDADLVDAAKRRAVADTELEKTSIPGLAASWSQALAVEGRHSPDERVTAIQRVSVADVNRVARRAFDLRGAITAILTPSPSGKAVSTKPFGGKESFTPPNTEPVPLPAWAEAAVNRLAVPPSTLNPVVTTLPNGIRLIVQPETVSNTVGVYGRVKNRPSLQVLPGQEGVEEVLDGLFGFGTRTRPRLDYQRALDEIGAYAAAGVDFELQVLTDHFDRGVELLADNVLDPALPEAAFKIVQDQLKARVAGRLGSAEYQAGVALRTALVPRNDPTLREASVASVSSLTLAAVRDYHQRAFRPDLTTIVVIGRVTPDAARATIEKHFGRWTAEGPTPTTDLPPVPLSRTIAVNVPNTARVQTKVVLAHSLGLNRFDPEYYALELGNQVLGGGFEATRLYRDLRHDAGLVYYVNSTLDMSRTRGFYLVDFGADPGNVRKSRSIVVQELRAMQTTPVTEVELRQAKAVLLRQIPLSEADMERIARNLRARATEGLALDEPTRAASRYLALTAEDVRAAFAKWIRPSELAQITEGPAPR